MTRDEIRYADTEWRRGPQTAIEAASEQVVAVALPGRALIVRPGVIVGPHDPSGRFGYWITRIGDGGEVLVPAPPAWVQVIDARDLARWMLEAAEAGLTGAFNTTGPTRSLHELLETIRGVIGSEARFVPVPEERLLAAGVTPWSELPLRLPGAEGKAFAHVDSSKAIAAGLTYRPLEATIRDTADWLADLTGEPPRQADGRYRRSGLSHGREQELLATVRASG